MSMLSSTEAINIAHEAEKEAESRGLIRTTYLFKLQDHFNRLVRLVNARYGTEYPTFKGHVVMVPNSEAVVTEMGAFGPNHGYTRPSPFIPAWMLELLTFEREWRRNPHKVADSHDAIVDAFAAGLRGDMDTLEAFFGLYDLNKEYEKELYGPTQAVNQDVYGFDMWTMDETRTLNGLPSLPTEGTT